MVLAAHSEYFHTKIERAIKWTTEEVPVIPVDGDIVSVSNLLQYMYTGNIIASNFGIMELCQQAEKYRMPRLLELCKKQKGITEVKQEAADKTSDSSLKNEDAVPMRWEYNSQETAQNTSSIYHSELCGPTSDISEGGNTMPNNIMKVRPGAADRTSDSSLMQEDAVAMRLQYNSHETPQDSSGLYHSELGGPILESGVKDQEGRGVDLSIVKQSISQSGHTVQDVRRVDLGAPASNISPSRDTVQEVSRVNLSIVKQEMKDSPINDTGCDGSSMSTLSCNAINSTTPPLSRSHVALPENIELDRDRLQNIVIKKEAKSDDEEEMVCDKLMDSNLRHDSGTKNPAKRGQAYDSPSVHKRIKTASGPVTFKTEDMSDTPIK